MAPNLQFRVTKPESRITSKEEARERLNDAIKAYEQAEGSLSIMQARRLYVVSKATLYRRIYGRSDQLSYEISKRRLTLEEEESMKIWLLEIHQLPVWTTIEPVKIHHTNAVFFRGHTTNTWKCREGYIIIPTPDVGFTQAYSPK